MVTAATDPNPHGVDTPPVGSLAVALAQFQLNLPRVGKDNTATVKSEKGHYSYRYADLAAVSAAVLPALAAHGLSWSTRPTLDDAGRLVLRYELLHHSGERLAGVYPLPAPAGASPQVLGSAITYARRYCLCAVTGVSPDDDDDGAAATHASDAAREPDWDTKIGNAVTAGDRGALAALWSETHRHQPGDDALRDRIKAAAQEIKVKTRRELERNLFALLSEGGITDSSAGRPARLAILSKLSGYDVTSLNDLDDTELGTVNTTLQQWRRSGRLIRELTDLSSVDGTPPEKTVDQREVFPSGVDRSTTGTGQR